MIPLLLIIFIVSINSYETTNNLLCSNHGVLIDKDNCICDDPFFSGINQTIEQQCNYYLDMDLPQVVSKDHNICHDSENDCDGHGKCKNGTCICDEEYATIIGSDIDCTYKRKYGWLALLLHALFGSLGVGHFYIGNVALAMGQFSLTIIIPCGSTYLIYIVFAILACCSVVEGEGRSMKICGVSMGLVIGVFALLSVLAMSVWWIVDIFLFAFNYYRDGNGIALVPI